MKFSKSFVFVISFIAQHVNQVSSLPCGPSPCFAQPESDTNTRKMKRTFKLKQRNKDEKIARALTTSTYLKNDFIKERLRRTLDKMDRRSMSRKHVGFRGIPRNHMVPNAYMSTQRYPRGQMNVGRKGPDQLQILKVVNGQTGSGVYTNEQLSTDKSPKGQAVSSDRKVSPQNFPAGERSQDILARGQTGNGMSPYGQMSVQGIQTGGVQEQIMRDAQEYWWKSGFLEGLKRKLGEPARKSAFPSETVFEGISGSKDGQKYSNKDNRKQVLKLKDVGNLERGKINQRSGRTSFGTTSGNTERIPKGIKTKESMPPEGQLGKNSGEKRIINRKMGTNIDQTGTLSGHEDETKDLFQGPNTEKPRRVENTSINERRWGTLQRTTTGQIRTTEGETGTNTGQAGTSGETGTSGASSENPAVQQENAEISNSSPDCSEPVDLAFLVDGSGSIDPFRQFPKVRKFLKELAAAFNIGPTRTKVALVQFSGKMAQRVEFGLDQHNELQGVINGIDSMQQLRGNTYVGEGFKLVSREVFAPGKGDRPEVRNVLMLFTDGAASDFDVAKEEAAKLKSNGTTIICVGAGREFMLQFFRSQLQEYASDPAEQYVFTKGFEELDKVVKAVSSITCEEAKNPPAPEGTNTTVDVNLNSYKTANHYWAFDVVNGDIVTDLIGRKRCTLTGGAHLFMSVKRKMVCSMVESGGYLDFGSWTGECITDPDLCTEGLTITMWLRIQVKDVNYNSEYQYIISSGAEGESMRGVVFLLKAKDEIYKLLVRTTGQAWSITLPADRIPSVWFSFAFSWKRSLGLAVYLNGFKVEENLKPTNVEGPDVSNSLFIARPATSTNLEYQTKFRIDDFAIFYRFLTDQEVQGILFEVGGPPSQGGADLCTPNPCQNGGTCSLDTDTPSGFVCQCLPGWTGDRCNNQGTAGGQTSQQSGGSWTSSSGESSISGQGQGQGTFGGQTSQGSSISSSGEPPNPSQEPQVSQSEPQNPPTSQNEPQSPAHTPSRPQEPSTTTSENQGQSPGTPSFTGASQTPTTTTGEPTSPGYSPPNTSGSSTTSTGRPEIPTGPSPPGQSPRPPGPSFRPTGQTPSGRPKECPPCPGTPGAPQGTPDNPKETPGTPHGTPGTPQATPGTPQETPGTPQGTPGTPERTPGTSQGTPDTPQGTPGTPQGIPGTSQATPSVPQGTPGIPQGTPGSPQGTPGIHQGTPGSPQGTHQNAPGIPGSSNAASPSPSIPKKPSSTGTSSGPNKYPSGPGSHGSSSTPKCTPIPPGSKICSSAPSRSLADAAHTYRYRLPPVFGPYDTADDYDCTPQCMSDCTSGGCSDACCGSCPPICKKVCRSDCPSRCCGKDAIIPSQRRHTIARPVQPRKRRRTKKPG